MAVDLVGLKIVIRHETLRTAERILQEAGARGVECLVLLAGRHVNNELLLDAVYRPNQRATAITVRLLPDSLISIHQNLAETGRIICLQIHTHPGSAFHTNTDDADTTVTQEGSISVVVPHYASDGLEGWKDCLAYVLQPDGWSAPRNPNELINVEP